MNCGTRFSFTFLSPFITVVLFLSVIFFGFGSFFIIHLMLALLSVALKIIATPYFVSFENINNCHFDASTKKQLCIYISTYISFALSFAFVHFPTFEEKKNQIKEKNLFPLNRVCVCTISIVVVYLVRYVLFYRGFDMLCYLCASMALLPQQN